MAALIEKPFHMQLPPVLAQLLTQVPELSRALVVGGGVRDAALGLQPKDLDIEVYGVGFEELRAALAPWGATDLVGRAFGVIKLGLANGEMLDFSIPRRDSKVGAGHRGFMVEADPSLTLETAASRRDFTLNTLAYDPRRGVILDHFGGLADLRARVLRHTSAAFTEDPLRVLRGMQLAARFDLTAAPETVALCHSILDTYRELSLDRVREEWFKWASRSSRPSQGLRFLQATGWLTCFPELAALVGVPQDPVWHPEGDVWEHTLHCVDALMELPQWQSAELAQRVVWGLATLLHDVGKPGCTRHEVRAGRERITSPGHDVAGGPIAERFLERIAAPHDVIARVVPLVVEHMAHLQASTSRAVRRLSVRVRPESVASLGVIIMADQQGRPPLPREVPVGLHAMLAKAHELEVLDSAPPRLLLGRHLLESGWQEGPGVGEVVQAAYEAQLDGEFADLPGALQWVQGHGRS